MLEYSNNKVVFNVQTPDAGVLVLKERYSPDWSVSINGEKKELLKANLLFRGVYVEAGDNNIVFEFNPTMKYAYITIICWIALIIVTIITIIFNKKNIVNEK